MNIFSRARNYLTPNSKAGKPDTSEVADRSSDPNVWDTDRYLNPDAILKDQNLHLGDYLKLLDDDRIGPTYDQRISAVICRERTVKAASDTPRDVEIADWVKAQLDGLGCGNPMDDNLDSTLRKMLLAILQGFSATEIIWQNDGNLVFPEALRVRPARRFAFSPDGTELRLLTKAKPWKGEPVPERKFIYLPFRSDPDNPYGRGLGRRLWFLRYYKRHMLLFWAQQGERYGSPSVLATFPGGDDKLATAAKTAARLLQAGASAGVPERVTLQLIEAAHSSWETFPRFLEAIDTAVTTVILHQNMTTESGSSRDQAEVHDRVRLEMMKEDAGNLAFALNNQLVRWMVDWNWMVEAYPHLVIETKPPRNMKARTEIFTALAKVGFPLSKSQVREELELRKPLDQLDIEDEDDDTFIGKASGKGTDDEERDDSEPLDPDRGFAKKKSPALSCCEGLDEDERAMLLRRIRTSSSTK